MNTAITFENLLLALGLDQTATSVEVLGALTAFPAGSHGYYLREALPANFASLTDRDALEQIVAAAAATAAVHRHRELIEGLDADAIRRGLINLCSGEPQDWYNSDTHCIPIGVDVRLLAEPATSPSLISKLNDVFAAPVREGDTDALSRLRMALKERRSSLNRNDAGAKIPTVYATSGTSHARIIRRLPASKAKHYLRRPAWVSKETFDSLRDPDETLRSLAQTIVSCTAESIFYRAYKSKLLDLVPPRLPVGLSFNVKRPKFEPPFFPFLTRREIEQQGAVAAVLEADWNVKRASIGWIHETADELCEVYYTAPWAMEATLKDALAELNDVESTYKCVVLCLSIKAEPPTWREVAGLIEAYPELPKFGFAKAVEAGFVPPPWVTSAMT